MPDLGLASQILQLLLAAIKCNPPPAKPESGSNLITSYGARYGPVCQELREGSGPSKELGRFFDSENCPGIRMRLTGTSGVYEWTFSILPDSRNGQTKDIFMRLEMTSPPLELMVNTVALT